MCYVQARHNNLGSLVVGAKDRGWGPGMRAGSGGTPTWCGCACLLVCSYNVILPVWILLCFTIEILLVYISKSSFGALNTPRPGFKPDISGSQVLKLKYLTIEPTEVQLIYQVKPQK